MKIGILLLIGVSFLFQPGDASTLAQERALAEQFMEALTPETSQKSQPVPQKKTRAVGVRTESTQEAGGDVNIPSLTLQLEFGFNSDALTSKTVKVLDALGTALQNPKLRGYVYRVEGHTDNVGSDAYNLELSRKRALAVVDHMVKTFGLSSDQFNPQGFGRKHPVASNNTEEGRQKNRRVVVINTLKPLDSPAVDKPELAVKVKYSRAKEEKELKDGGTLTQRDNYSIEFVPKATAFVYIFQVDTMGRAEPLFPNQKLSQTSNMVEPDRLYRIPELGKWLYLDENKGKEHIVVIANRTALKDPLTICERLVGLKGAGSQPSTSASIESESEGATKTRGLAGIREDKSLHGANEAHPIKPISMDGIFVWKLFFMHQ